MRSNDAYAFLDHYNMDVSAVVNGLNQATSVGGNTVSYDDRGNVTSHDGKTYSYYANGENIMWHADGASIYTDAAGRMRYVTKSGATSIRYQYAGSSLVAETDTSGAVLRRYVHGASVDEPLVWYEGSGTSDRRFLIPDERGSIVAIANSSGTVTDVNTYDAYGRPGASNVGRFQYTGQTWIAEVGLYYYKARWYNPELGRFMQTDPIGYGDGMNMYAYVGGDPVNYTDPLGLSRGRGCAQQSDGKWLCSDWKDFGGPAFSNVSFGGFGHPFDLTDSFVGDGEGGLFGAAGAFGRRQHEEDVQPGENQPCNQGLLAAGNASRYLAHFGQKSVGGLGIAAGVAAVVGLPVSSTVAVGLLGAAVTITAIDIGGAALQGLATGGGAGAAYRAAGNAARNYVSLEGISRFLPGIGKAASLAYDTTGFTGGPPDPVYCS